jgi:uncharacterized peroxidase-related enzyme
MHPVSRFALPRLEELPADIRARIEAVHEKAGFIPNIFLVLARRPDEFRAFFAYHDALMDKPGPLTKAERELIVVATSATNDCLYCVIAHGAVLRIRARDSQIADQVATNFRTARLSVRERAMLEFATRLARSPGDTGEADIAALRAAGFDDEAIWDIGAITSFFALSNRMATLTELRPNDEFYGMGRQPIDKP